MKFNSKLILFVVLLTCISTYAQKTITGIVIDKENKQPIPGVNISALNSKSGTISNFDGKFKLDVPENATTIEASFIGFQNQKVTLNENSNYTIIMSSGQDLEEVVVIGYGKQSRKDISTSLQYIKAEDLPQGTTSSFENTLQGQTAGVNISSSSATPGSAVSVNIRGVSSISASSQPLYIIDGVPMVSRNNSALNANIQPVNPLADINPADIESFSILKDAAAAAIYGSRGANGVILITTKRGKTGVSSVNVNYYSSISEITNYPKMVDSNKFKSFFNTAAEFDGLGADYFDWIDTSKGINTNIYDEIFRLGVAQNLDLSLKGGNEKTSFYVSGNYFNQDGIQIGQGFKRLSGRLNLDHAINDKFKVGNTLFVTRSNHQRTIGENDEYGVVINAQGWDPTQPIYKENGDYTNPFKYNTWWPLENPVQIANEYKNISQSTRVQGSTYLEWRIIPDLKFKTALSMDYSNLVESSYVPSGTNKSKTGEGIYATYEETNWLVENTLNYKKQFGEKHNFGTILGWTLQGNQALFSDQSGVGYATNSTASISAASTITSSTSGKNQYGLQSFFGRADYVYNDKYIASFTVRADGSSRFGENNRYGYFPSGSVAWRVNKEDFFKIKTISDFKIRASYGITGNQEISSNWKGTYSLNANYNGVPGIAPSRLGNPDLGWETTTQTNIGLDFGLFKNRISLTADYFDKKTDDLLLQSKVSGLTGFNSVFQNVGAIQNKGFEIAINAAVIDGEQFKWNTGVNLTLLENKITKLNNDGEEIGRNHILKEGEAVSTLYLIKFLGVNPDNGDALFDDVNKDGIIDFSDRQIVGGAIPTYYGGWTNNFSYKRFTLTANFLFSGGNKIFNQSRHVYDNYGFTRSDIPYSNISERVYDNYWRTPGQITNVPRPSTEAGQMQRFSTQFLEDGDYIRLKTLNLTYKLPTDIIGKMGLNNLSIYVQAQNLFTLTDYLGFDPEVSTNTSSQEDLNILQGEDFGTLGQARTFTIGLSTTF
ncbi:MAG: TonB-dependent receptor [Flavobacterium sp.]|nr:TonB-dependent receptor [Flavobacterium sp.]